MVAPAASSAFLAISAVLLGALESTVFGAVSTRFFASFNPKPVKTLTSFMTLIFSLPESWRITSQGEEVALDLGGALCPGGLAVWSATSLCPHLVQWMLFGLKGWLHLLQTGLSMVFLWRVSPHFEQ